MVRKLSVLAVALAASITFTISPVLANPTPTQAPDGTVIVQGTVPAGNDPAVVVEDGNQIDRSTPAKPDSYVIKPDGSIDTDATQQLHQQAPDAATAAPDAEIIVFPTVERRPDPSAVTPGQPDFPSIPVTVYKRVKNIATRSTLASRAGHPRVITYYSKVAEQIDIAPIILKYATQFKVDPYLVKAVIKTESCFRPMATSYCGAVGLMQLMPPTGYKMGARDLYDVEQNIAAGTRYLRLMLDTFNQTERAVAAYNAGPAAVSASGGIPHITETQNYVRRVMDALRTYKKGN